MKLSGRVDDEWAVERGDRRAAGIRHLKNEAVCVLIKCGRLNSVEGCVRAAGVRESAGVRFDAMVGVELR